MNTKTQLTAWDYMNLPIKQLVVHPDYDPDRWRRLCQALGEARNIIEEALS